MDKTFCHTTISCVWVFGMLSLWSRGKTRFPLTITRRCKEKMAVAIVWMVVSLQNFHFGVLMPRVTVLESGVCVRWLGHKGETSWLGLALSKKTLLTGSPHLSSLWGYKEILHLKKAPSLTMPAPWLRHPSSINISNKFPLFISCLVYGILL